MCYSAVIWQDYRRYVKVFGAEIDIHAFVELFWRRREDPRIKISKALEESFMNPQSEDEEKIKTLILEHRAAQIQKFEQELFAQRKRLADAERVLQVKTTKKAINDQEMAGKNIKKLKRWLDDLQRTKAQEGDARIFPG